MCFFILFTFTFLHTIYIYIDVVALVMVSGTAQVCLDPSEASTSCCLLMDHNPPLMTWPGTGLPTSGASSNYQFGGLSWSPLSHWSIFNILGYMRCPGKRSFCSDQRIYLTGWQTQPFSLILFLKKSLHICFLPESVFLTYQIPNIYIDVIITGSFSGVYNNVYAGYN